MQEEFSLDSLNDVRDWDNDQENGISEEFIPDEVEVVGVRFKKSGKVYYFDPCGVKYNVGVNVLVKTTRGVEYGVIAMTNTVVDGAEIVPPLRRVVRAATPTDDERHLANIQSEKEAFRIFNGKIKEHHLEMKLVDVEYTFDNNRLTFYFTADGRVDFRELVKDLASVFKTRIELRQIGIRDETKITGGLGVCGRPFCCCTFLSEFSQVSIKMAKEQNLSLNSAKISGACGKLMCCLRYEHDVYEEETKKTPKIDSVVQTPDGEGTVTEANVLAGTVKVKLFSEPDKAPKLYKRDDVIRTVKGESVPQNKQIPVKQEEKPVIIPEKLEEDYADNINGTQNSAPKHRRHDARSGSHKKRPGNRNHKKNNGSYKNDEPKTE
ncbi:MAG: stage 0 sporulation family protein [Clostridia bacterium]|nr:stage 0 sporulation family protein [Clostridia bacterium]